jgi:hypothetical protein
MQVETGRQASTNVREVALDTYASSIAVRQHRVTCTQRGVLCRTVAAALVTLAGNACGAYPEEQVFLRTLGVESAAGFSSVAKAPFNY